MDRSALVHTEDTEGLQAPWPLEHLAVHAGTFIGRLIAAGPEAGDVQKHVRQPIVWHDETITLGNIEPFDGPGDFEDFYSGLAGVPWVCSTFAAELWLIFRKLRREFAMSPPILEPPPTLLRTAATTNPRFPSHGHTADDSTIRV